MGRTNVVSTILFLSLLPLAACNVTSMTCVSCHTDKELLKADLEKYPSKYANLPESS